MDAESGLTLRKASEKGREAVMRLLLEHKADANLAFQHDDESLRGISIDDHEAVIQLLLEKLEMLKSGPYNPENTVVDMQYQSSRLPKKHPSCHSLI